MQLWKVKILSGLARLFGATNKDLLYQFRLSLEQKLDRLMIQETNKMDEEKSKALYEEYHRIRQDLPMIIMKSETLPRAVVNVNERIQSSRLAEIGKDQSL